MNKPRKFRAHDIEVLGCGPTLNSQGTPSIAITFRMGKNPMPINFYLTNEQAERLVDDFQSILANQTPAGRTERRQVRQQNRDQFKTRILEQNDE